MYILAHQPPGGTRGRRFDGTDLSVVYSYFGAATPTIMTPAHFAGDRVHAVLGGLERLRSAYIAYGPKQVSACIGMQ